jgi:branched-chain amino acid transport system permease protein
MSRGVRRTIGLAAFLAAGPLLVWLVPYIGFLGPANLVILGFSALAATGLTLIMGFAGQISLGHAAFYGIGAYAVTLLTVKSGWAPGTALLAGLAMAAAAAAILGIAILRVRGHFMAMATLAFGLIFYFFVRGSEFTGGNQGIGGIPSLSIFGTEMTGDTSMFLFTWAVLAVGILIAANIIDSRSGRALRAMGSSEVAAQCCGIDVARLKVSVFVLGALYASLAGSLYATYISYTSPEAFGVLASIQFLVISVVGGLRSVWGAPIGAFFMILLSEGSRDVVPMFFEGATGSYETVAYGAALALVLLLLPQGLAGGLRDVVRRVASARVARATAGSATAGPKSPASFAGGDLGPTAAGPEADR